MHIGKLCNRNVVVVDRDVRVQEAARLMREHHVGDLVVVEGEGNKAKPVGILTDRDIVVGVVAKDIEHLGILTVGDVISRELVTALFDEDHEEVLHRMRFHGIRRIPVVDSDGSLHGIFTMDDLLEHLAHDMASVAALLSRQPRREAARRS
jgi:CBS domain-containing protein